MGATVGEVFLGSGTPLGFRVINVEYINGVDGAADQVTVTWVSKSNTTYAVDTSATLPAVENGWEEQADGVESGGDETSFTADVAADATQLYIRVRQE